VLAAVTLAALPAIPAFAEDPADENPAPPADSHKKPPSYTDDDLEKYHKPKPGDVEPANPPATAPEPAPAGGPAPAGSGKPQMGPPKPAIGPAKPAVPARAAGKPAPAKPQAPPDDPTAPWKMKDARAAFRQDQIKQAREKLAGLESRLDYLNRKREAIQNPVPVQAGKLDKLQKPDISPRRASASTPPPSFFPSLPEPQTDQDKENDKQMKVGDLLASVDEEIKSVESDIEDAKRDLVTVETRFAQESAQP
jgi:hypothetical protein